MNHWLLKSEPGTFSIDDLAARPRKTTSWDGVRNFQVRNMLRDAVRKGDQAFFYHSSCAVPGIVGIVTVTREAYPDATAFDPMDAHYDAGSTPENPRWYTIDVRLTARFDRVVTLDELRGHASATLSDLLILRRGNRLSVTPVAKREWDFILSLA